MSMELGRFNPMERGPRMLKDFLSENSNSCSSSGFKSFPRKPIHPPGCSMRSLMEMEYKSRNSIPTSPSSKSVFQTLINAVKSISFATVKSPSILPRSLSRRLSERNYRKETDVKGGEIKFTVKIKDIVRWKSFRDLVEEQPFDSIFSPHRCTTATTATGSTTSTTTCSSNGSSWSDTDFTSSWDGNFAEHELNDVEAGKSFSPSVGKGSVDATTGRAGNKTAVGSKEVVTCQEEEQSPVSVVQSRENEFSPFHQSLASIERKTQRFMQTIQKFESLAELDLENLENCLSLVENTGSGEEYDVHEKDDGGEDEKQDRIEKGARQLLHCVKANDSGELSETNLDKLLLDFFRDELNIRINQTGNIDDEIEREVLRIAEDWIDGLFEYEIEHNNKDAYIKDMERGERWSKFEEEQEELAWKIETAVLEDLLVEVLDLGGFPSQQDLEELSGALASPFRERKSYGLLEQ